jgi:hypothetical protein
VERLSGSKSVPVTWAELDADYTLKLPALFHPCLDALTEALAGAFDLFGMGRRGIAPITHFTEIAAGPEPIALGRPLELRYTVELRRARLPGSAGRAPRDRLLLDQHVTLHGFRRAGSATDLGFDDGSGGPVQAGTFRLVQVFTRPFAPPGEREVREVPAEFRALAERPLAGPPPSVEALWAGAEALAERTPPGALPLERVWGRGHTDINHHVTVAEYLRLLETAHVALVLAAGLPVAAHRSARMACLFRRPFFAGERCAVQGRLLRDGAVTWLLGGIHRRGPHGDLEPEPSVAARLEGTLEEAPPRTS